MRILSENILSTNKISKKFGNFQAVSDLDLELCRGEIYGLIGKNGAGKTTLLKMISGLSNPSGGSLQLLGETTESGFQKARAKTGCMIESPGFLPYLSANDNLEYYRLQRGMKDKSCVQKALKFVGLSGTGTKKFKNFSLGMKQRLGLALAVLDDPELLILDEPINGLDPMGIAEFREMILSLNHEKGTTVLISSHILGELSQIATTFGFMNDGKLIEHISAADLKEKCKMNLKLTVDNTERAAKILEQNLSCNEFQIENEREIHLDAFLDTPEIVVKELVENDVMVSGVERTGLNLEEYFINLVGGMQHV